MSGCVGVWGVGGALMLSDMACFTACRYGLYRDIIIESEYDPLQQREHYLKYKPRKSDELIAEKMLLGAPHHITCLI